LPRPAKNPKTTRLDGHHTVGFRQDADDIVHPSHFPNRDLFSELEVLETRPAGNQACSLALEYLQTQERRGTVADQLNAVGVEADGVRLDGLTLPRVQKPVEHLQSKLSIVGVNVAQALARNEQNEF